MKTINIKLFGLLLLFFTISCGGGGDDPTPPEPPLPPKLIVPKIISPQSGAVCQGTLGSDGTYEISVSTSEIYGTIDYTFTIWDSSGNIIETKKVTSTQVSFSKLEAGKSYTVAVEVSNSSYSVQSTKISFSTPGAKVVNYIPVVKKAVYLKEDKLLTLLFYDADESDEELFYSVLTSESSDFKVYEKIKDIEKVKNGEEILLPISLENSTYFQIIVLDKLKNTSSYVLYVE